MDKNISFVIEKKVEKTIENLKKNGMNGYFVQDRSAALAKVKELIAPGQRVAVGGSMTIFEIGAIDLFRNGDYNFLDRYDESLKPEELKNVFRQSFLADVFVASTNAITENGELYNVDGNGNRVAAITYGPDKVILIAGINKLTTDLDQAAQRVKSISRPANCVRLRCQTPCVKTGYCAECASADRICNIFSVIKKQRDHGRLHVIIVNENLGY